MKTIVTHISPDLDACSSTWLIKRFLPNWHGAQVVFVDAGTTLHNMPPDEDPETIHVDTGLGKFDHHQCSEKLSAARRVFDYLHKTRVFKTKDEEALDRLVDYVTLIDNFGEVHFPESSADFYEFSLHRIIDGLKSFYQNDQRVMELTLTLLDATFISFKNKIHAEKEMLDGTIINTPWGKGLAIESKDDEVMPVALKNNYAVVVRKDPAKGYMRIKAFPRDDIDLTDLYKRILEKDTTGTWFLHASTHMLLNGSSKSRNSVPTTLSLSEVIEIIAQM
jgi:hypothetical protein